MEKFEIKCDMCFTIVKRKTDLAKHKKSETCKKINNIIKILKEEKQDEVNKLQDKLNKQKNEYELKLKLLEEKNNILVKENNDQNKKILTLEIKLKEVSEKSNEYRKIVEKSATKTTIKNNYTHNNYLNYISSEPLKIKEIPKQLKQIINTDSVMYDDDDFHDHIVDNILKDKSGKDKVLCTDINRKNFTYKDENSGELISDPELERLREQLKKGTNIKKLRKDLLEKLVTEYENNGYTGIDPYKQFSEIIQKLNFGSPFVDHVAKKTYIKTKSNYKQSNDEQDNEDNKEYEKLLEEFGNDLDV